MVRATIFAFLLILSITSAQAAGITSLTVFGDSLSDVGNVFKATGGLIPGAPNYNGQFSNGNVWAQDLSQSLGLGTLTPSLLGGTDYAVGSGQSGTTLYNTAGLADLPNQLAAFHTANAIANPNGLYVIWIGSNDLRAIPSTATQTQINTDIGAIVGNIDAAVNNLASLGAKNFLVITVPDLGLTPGVRAAGPAAMAAASALAAGFNTTLVNGSGAALPSLSALAAADSIKIAVLNSYALVDTISNNPGAFNLTDVSDPCLVNENYTTFSGGTPCATPNQYLFWDNLHPTAATHQIIANQALALVVPEPSSLTLFAGALIATAALHRRQRSSR